MIEKYINILKRLLSVISEHEKLSLVLGTTFLFILGLLYPLAFFLILILVLFVFYILKRSPPNVKESGALIIGFLLIVFVFIIAWYFIVPPFYYVSGAETAGFKSASLSPNEEKVIWEIGRSAELDYVLSFTVSSDQPVVVHVYSDGEEIYRGTGTMVQKQLGESLPQQWGLRVGKAFSIKIVNLNQISTDVSLSFDYSFTYRDGSFINVVVFFFGLLTVTGTMFYSNRRVEEERWELRRKESETESSSQGTKNV